MRDSRAGRARCQREGTAFDIATGLPEPMARKLNSRSWLSHAMADKDVGAALNARDLRLFVGWFSRVVDLHGGYWV